MKWLENITWQKLVLILVVLLIVVRTAHPPTAEWILAPIVGLTQAAIQAIQDFGG